MSDVLAWLDVETTGLNPFLGERLLEVACILTDTNLNVLSEPYQAVVKYSRKAVYDMKQETDEYVVNMHEASGLWDRVQGDKAKSLLQIEEELLAHIKQHAPEPRQARLAGNSVTLDLNFLRAYLGYVYDHLHYRSIDVTGINYFLTEQGLITYRDKGTSSHEALADIQASIEELRDIRQQLESKRQQTTRHTNPPRTL